MHTPSQQTQPTAHTSICTAPLQTAAGTFLSYVPCLMVMQQSGAASSDTSPLLPLPEQLAAMVLNMHSATAQGGKGLMRHVKHAARCCCDASSSIHSVPGLDSSHYQNRGRQINGFSRLLGTAKQEPCSPLSLPSNL